MQEIIHFWCWKSPEDETENEKDNYENLLSIKEIKINRRILK